MPVAEEDLIDREQLSAHHVNLDAAYKFLQKAYKAMTYEVGRLEDEPGLEVLGAPAAGRLGALAAQVEKLGKGLKDFVLHEDMDVENNDGTAD